MPELPEVETVRRGLARLVPVGTRIARVRLLRQDLRARIPADLPETLGGAVILGFRRHGKYLLWDTSRAILLCHLGMTGSWRAAPPGDERAHDHCHVELGDGRRLVYRDPRRFGLLDFVQPGEEAQHPALADLGPDALDAGAFTAASLALRAARRTAAVKAVLLDQRTVAGIGNIYADEALHRAGIRPRIAAGRLTRARCGHLVAALREVLEAAIASGGSTLRDYRGADGEEGWFQHRFHVYGRRGEPCHACATTLRGAVVGGRSTVWCPSCQT